MQNKPYVQGHSDNQKQLQLIECHRVRARHNCDSPHRLCIIRLVFTRVVLVTAVLCFRSGDHHGELEGNEAKQRRLIGPTYEDRRRTNKDMHREPRAFDW